MYLSDKNFEKIKQIINIIKHKDINDQELRNMLFDILVIESQEPSFLKTAILLEILSRKRYSSAYNEQIMDSLNNIFNNFKSLDKIERQIIRYLFLHGGKNIDKKGQRITYKNFVESISAKESLTRQILLSGKKHRNFFYTTIKKKKHFIKKMQYLMAARVDVSFFPEDKAERE